MKFETMVIRFSGLVLLLLGMARLAPAPVTPEIDPGSGVSALLLLSGALLVVRSRR